MTWAHFAHFILGIFLGLAPAAIKLLTQRYNGTDPVMTAIKDEAMRRANMNQPETVIPEDQVEKVSCPEKPDN